MDIQQVPLLCDEELDAVVGGMANNGQGQFLQTPKNTGGGRGSSGDLVGGLLVTAAIIGLATFGL